MPWPKEVPFERYPSDLTDEEGKLLEAVFEEVEPYTTGRPRTTDLREIVNVIFLGSSRTLVEPILQLVID